MVPLWTRFWSKVNICSENECWEWQAAFFTQGNFKYGQFWLKGRAQYAHRVSWELFNAAEIPKGLRCLHTCDNPSCVNPKHLILGTDLDNTRDMISKGRMRKPQGEAHGLSILKENDILKIRKLYIPRKMSSRKLAKLFGVSKSTILKVVNGSGWKHVS